MKTITTLLLVFYLTHLAEAQTVLTLQECYERAESNYPQIRQRELIKNTKIFSVENASRGSLPQVTLGGQATYQSEVTQIPVEMPGVEPLSKDQYRIFGEVAQTLYHGGLVGQRSKMAEVNADLEARKLEVELYQIRNRVNELFFGILLMQEQLAQTHLVREDLSAGLRKVQAAIENGTAIPSEADVIRAEALRVNQRIVELESTIDSYRVILSRFVNESINSNTVLEKPSFDNDASTINRPELRLFETQRLSVETDRNMLSASKKPRVELFIQGGYGRPGLNMLENEFSLYYVGGVRLSWQLSGYYTFRRERQILDLRRQSLDVQQETFLFNTELNLDQHDQEIAKLRRLIEVDDAIIALRTRVRQTAEVQLEEGVITSTDFVREVNAEDQAKQNKALHETQLLVAQAKYQFTSGQ